MYDREKRTSTVNIITHSMYILFVNVEGLGDLDELTVRTTVITFTVAAGSRPSSWGEIPTVAIPPATNTSEQGRHFQRRPFGLPSHFLLKPQRRVCGLVNRKESVPSRQRQTDSPEISSPLSPRRNSSSTLRHYITTPFSYTAPIKPLKR